MWEMGSVWGVGRLLGVGSVWEMGSVWGVGRLLGVGSLRVFAVCLLPSCAHIPVRIPLCVVAVRA